MRQTGSAIFGCQHHFALPRRCGKDRLAAGRGQRQRAVERAQHYVTVQSGMPAAPVRAGFRLRRAKTAAASRSSGGSNSAGGDGNRFVKR